MKNRMSEEYSKFHLQESLIAVSCLSHDALTRHTHTTLIRYSHTPNTHHTHTTHTPHAHTLHSHSLLSHAIFSPSPSHSTLSPHRSCCITLLCELPCPQGRHPVRWLLLLPAVSGPMFNWPACQLNDFDSTLRD